VILVDKVDVGRAKRTRTGFFARKGQTTTEVFLTLTYVECTLATGRTNMMTSDFIPAEGDLVLRDDQADVNAIYDEARRRRERGNRLRLIDSGRATTLELERLCLAGVDVFTSDKAGRALADWIILAKSAEKGGGSVAHFQHGPFVSSPPAGGPSLEDLKEAARLGIRIYLSDKTEKRKAEDIIALAEAARDGGRRLGFYHHGPEERWLSELARRSAWIHVSPDLSAASAPSPLLLEVAAEAAARGAGLVVHVEQAASETALEDLREAGAYLLFRTPPSDYRSPLRPLEEKAARRLPDPTASYIYSEFMR